MGLPVRPPNGLERPDGQPGRSTTRTLSDETKVDARIADAGDDVSADLVAWRCRHTQCVQRPLHDRMDWWPSWAEPLKRWSA
jgi:hypothetical protein